MRGDNSMNLFEFATEDNFYRCEFNPKVACLQLVDLNLPNIPILLSTESIGNKSLTKHTSSKMSGLIKHCVEMWDKIPPKEKIALYDEVPLKSFIA